MTVPRLERDSTRPLAARTLVASRIDGPAHAEHAAQLALFGEDLAWGELAADDPSADALDDAGVDAGRAGRAIAVESR